MPYVSRRRRSQITLWYYYDNIVSVLTQDNVMGREYAYVNATMRNRRAFILAVHEVGAAFAMCVVLCRHCTGSITVVVVARGYK